jgi:predicted TPR repeat methyltransferase
MSTADPVLQQAMIAHRAGRLAAAEVGYRRVLRRSPNDSAALHFLALLLFHQGSVEEAIDHLRRSLQHAPSNSRAWNALGGMLVAAGRVVDASDAYRHATEVAPDVAEGWYNLAISVRDMGDINHAEQCLREAMSREPNYFRAHEALAMLLYQMGRTGEAATVYADWAARDPLNAKARFMAAAATGVDVPGHAPADYVRDLFDEAAKSFDTNLEQLAYQAHRKVAEALIEKPSKPFARVLDAGCGTGLCGPLIRAHCGTLVGVDLSAGMIDRARALNCYDELVVAELTEFFRSRAGEFAAVIAADTVVYFGSLGDLLAGARGALRPGGCLVFTVEALEDGVAVDYELRVHGRYAHREGYVRAALGIAGFEVESLRREVLRRERDLDVLGYVVVATT